MLLINDGTATFQVNGSDYICSAPCFVCFDEKHDVTLIKKRKLRAKAVYFHPQFLNINMTFSFIRSPHYNDLASIHDLFLLRPFTDGPSVIPIISDYLPKLSDAFNQMQYQLSFQPDWYWSCRTRSGFIDILITLEKHFQMLQSGELVTYEGHHFIHCDYVKKALLYIEANYMNKITFTDVLLASGINHTTLTANFKAQTGLTVMDYCQKYRIEVAKKKLRFTDVPLKDIATTCGFATTEHFSRIFKQYAGASPALFRKQSVEKRRKELQNL